MAESSNAPVGAVTVTPQVLHNSPTNGTPAEQSDEANLEAITAAFTAGKLGQVPKTMKEAPAEESGEEIAPELQAPGEVEETEEVATEEAPAAEQSKLDRAAAAAKRAKQASQRNKEMRAQQERLASQAQRAQFEAQQLRLQAQRAEQFQQLLRQDPYAALKQLGMTEQQVAERILREGTPEAAIRQVQEQLAAERQERIRLQQSIAAEKQAVVAAQQQNAFLQRATDEKVYPNLAEIPPKVIMAATRQLCDDLKAEGYDVQEIAALTDTEVCEALEKQFAAARKKKAPAATQTKASTTTKPGVAKTLTNRLGTAKYTIPADYEKLPEDEQMEHLTKMATTLMTRRD